MKRKLEGHIIAVPLQDNTFVTSLVIRQNGSISLGYFFKERYTELPMIEQWQPSEVILIALFGGRLGLKNGNWQLLGQLPQWDRNEWQVPILRQQDPINTSVYYAVMYDNDIKNFTRKIIYEEEAKTYYLYGIYGYKAIENVLNKLLFS